MDPADIPEQRVFPRRTLMVLASTLGGLLIGIAWVLGSDRWNKVSPDDPIKILIGDAQQRISATALARSPSAWKRRDREPAALVSEDQK